MTFPLILILCHYVVETVTSGPITGRILFGCYLVCEQPNVDFTFCGNITKQTFSQMDSSTNVLVCLGKYA